MTWHLHDLLVDGPFTRIDTRAIFGLIAGGLGVVGVHVATTAPLGVLLAIDVVWLVAFASSWQIVIGWRRPS